MKSSAQHFLDCGFCRRSRSLFAYESTVIRNHLLLRNVAVNRGEVYSVHVVCSEERLFPRTPVTLFPVTHLYACGHVELSRPFGALTRLARVVGSVGRVAVGREPVCHLAC